MIVRAVRRADGAGGIGMDRRHEAGDIAQIRRAAVPGGLTDAAHAEDLLGRFAEQAAELLVVLSGILPGTSWISKFAPMAAAEADSAWLIRRLICFIFSNVLART